MPECNISTSPNERWEPVVGYEGLYAVTTLGRVLSMRTGQVLKPQLFYKARYEGSSSENYLTVLLFKDPVGDLDLSCRWCRRFAVHQLVLTAFCGPQPAGQCCLHLDGNNLNNELNNLVWGLRSKKLGLVRVAPTLDELKRVLRYDPHTGHFYWRVRPHGKAHSICPDDVAGVLNKKGYVRIYYAGKHYGVNQLVWWFMTGSWPPRSLNVEHRNADKADNRWANLFLVTTARNLQNPNDKLQKDNRSGCRGVFVLPNGKCRAYIKVDGQGICLGTYANLEQAIAARKEAERRYFGPGRSEALDLKLRAVLGDNYTLRRISFARPIGISPILNVLTP